MNTDEGFYDDWYSDHKDNLKTDFLMSLTHEELRDFILNDSDIEEEFFCKFETAWDKFKSERFRTFREDY